MGHPGLFSLVLSVSLCLCGEKLSPHDMLPLSHQQEEHAILAP